MPPDRTHVAAITCWGQQRTTIWASSSSSNKMTLFPNLRSFMRHFMHRAAKSAFCSFSFDALVLAHTMFLFFFARSYPRTAAALMFDDDDLAPLRPPFGSPPAGSAADEDEDDGIIALSHYAPQQPPQQRQQQQQQQQHHAATVGSGGVSMRGSGSSASILAPGAWLDLRRSMDEAIAKRTAPSAAALTTSTSTTISTAAASAVTPAPQPVSIAAVRSLLDSNEHTLGEHRRLLAPPAAVLAIVLLVLLLLVQHRLQYAHSPAWVYGEKGRCKALYMFQRVWSGRF